MDSHAAFRLETQVQIHVNSHTAAMRMTITTTKADIDLIVPRCENNCKDAQADP